VYEFKESLELKNKKVNFAAAGEEFSIFLTCDGKVFGTGLNNVGQCGSSPE
jgi:alpha-tubulin suppressor-like RCC1 family protein